MPPTRVWGDAELLPDSCGLGQRKAGRGVTPAAGRVALCCPQLARGHWSLQARMRQEDLGSVDLGGCLELSGFRWSQAQAPALPPWDPLSNQARLRAIGVRGIIWRNTRSMWVGSGILATSPRGT